MAPRAYRYELSKSGRAACQNIVCKREGPKIQKGELRFGNWADYGEFQGWKWKHWGCVTPLQIANVQTDIEGLDFDDDDDMGVLDGWEELPEWARDKIRQSLKDGHVADEDWKGDLEKNRPGQRGMFSSRKKKAATMEDLDSDKDRPADDTPTKPKKAKKSKKAASKEEDDEEDLAEREGTPISTRKKRGKKAKKEEPEESAEEVMPAKKKRAAPKKRKTSSDAKNEIKSEDNEQLVPEPPKKKPRTKKEKVKKEESGGEMDLADLPERPAVKKEAVDVSAEMADLPEAKPARKSRVKKIKTESVAENNDEDMSAAKPSRKPRAKKAKQEVRNEPINEEQAGDLKDDQAVAEDVKPGPKGQDKKYKSEMKHEPVDYDQMGKLGDAPAVVEPAKPAPRGRSKKPPANKEVVKKEEPESENELEGPRQEGQGKIAKVEGEEDIKNEKVGESETEVKPVKVKPKAQVKANKGVKRKAR